MVAYNGDHVYWNGYFKSPDRLAHSRKHHRSSAGMWMLFLPTRLSSDNRLSIFEAFCSKLESYPQKICYRGQLALMDYFGRSAVPIIFYCAESDKSDLLSILEMISKDVGVSPDWHWKLVGQAEKDWGKRGRLLKEAESKGVESFFSPHDKKSPAVGAGKDDAPLKERGKIALSIRVSADTMQWIESEALRLKVSEGEVVDGLIRKALGSSARKKRRSDRS